MMEKLRNHGPLAPAKLAALTAALWPLAGFAQTTTQDIRMVTYNTQDDVGGSFGGPSPSEVLPYLSTMIEAIGQEKYVGDSLLQLPDIVALQETTSNSATVAPIVSALNSYYGSSIFNYSTYQATQSGGDNDGNGPNALIYNQNTLNLIASVGVGTPGGGTSSSPYYGEFRQIVRYEFQPIADKGTSNGIFYVYDDHYKSGSSGTSDDGSTDGNLRNLEAIIVRNDEAANLPANAAVVYVGDYNVDGSTDAMYQTLTAPKSPSGVSQGQAFDPLNPPTNTTNYEPNYTQNWHTSTYKNILTDSDTDLDYRDDLQTMTSNVYYDTPGNLDYIANSNHTFGNNGTTAYGGSTYNSYPTNTSLNDINGNGPLTAQGILNSDAVNGSYGSDHLPVVADYSLALPGQNLTWDNAPATLVNDGATWDINHYLNWNSGPNATTYTESSTVTFNDNNNGHYSVTLNTTVNPASVTFSNSNGNYTLSGSGTIAGTGSLTKTGTGTVVLSTLNSYTGGTFVNQGLLQINPTPTVTIAGSALPAGAVNISGSGILKLSDNVTTSTVGSFPNSNVNISSLSISSNGTLDIGNNAIIINYNHGADPISSIAGWIASGYASGTWTGPGITSTDAQSNSSYGIGYADANDPGDPAGLSSGQIEVMYTLLGDANLDGKVNGADFTLMAANFNDSVTNGWDEGDFNYDNVVNGDDFVLLADNFNQFASQSAVGAADLAALDAFAATNDISLTSVPEPASFALLATATIGLLARRKRAT